LVNKRVNKNRVEVGDGGVYLNGVPDELPKVANTGTYSYLSICSVDKAAWFIPVW